MAGCLRSIADHIVDLPYSSCDAPLILSACVRACARVGRVGVSSVGRCPGPPTASVASVISDTMQRPQPTPVVRSQHENLPLVSSLRLDMFEAGFAKTGYG